MKRFICVAVVAQVSLLGIGELHAKRSASQLLTCWDDNSRRAKDQYMVYDMEIQDKQSGGSRMLTTKVWLKGSMRLVHFVAPGNVAGMKVLARSRSQMYVYLKGFNRIRRITSHARSQTLFGADYNYDDQATVFFAEAYDPRLLKEDERVATLMLERKAKADAAYRRIEVTLRKKDCVPLTLKYFDERYKHIKTEKRSDYHCLQGVCNAKLMHMVNHTRNDHWTKIHQRSWKLNVGLSDRKFSRQALLRRN